jgi:hypothetical protein
MLWQDRAKQLHTPDHPTCQPPAAGSLAAEEYSKRQLSATPNVLLQRTSCLSRG